MKLRPATKPGSFTNSLGGRQGPDPLHPQDRRTRRHALRQSLTLDFHTPVLQLTGAGRIYTFELPELPTLIFQNGLDERRIALQMQHATMENARRNRSTGQQCRTTEQAGKNMKKAHAHDRHLS